jgi:hypothetical protein
LGGARSTGERHRDSSGTSQFVQKFHNSFDTDCINYSQGLINESKSSIIRLTYLMCKS